MPSRSCSPSVKPVSLRYLRLRRGQVARGLRVRRGEHEQRVAERAVRRTTEDHVGDAVVVGRLDLQGRDLLELAGAGRGDRAAVLVRDARQRRDRVAEVRRHVRARRLGRRLARAGRLALRLLAGRRVLRRLGGGGVVVAEGQVPDHPADDRERDDDRQRHRGGAPGVAVRLGVGEDLLAEDLAGPRRRGGQRRRLRDGAVGRARREGRDLLVVRVLGALRRLLGRRLPGRLLLGRLWLLGRLPFGPPVEPLVAEPLVAGPPGGPSRRSGPCRPRRSRSGPGRPRAPGRARRARWSARCGRRSGCRSGRPATPCPARRSPRRRPWCRRRPGCPRRPARSGRAAARRRARRARVARRAGAPERQGERTWQEVAGLVRA